MEELNGRRLVTVLQSLRHRPASTSSNSRGLYGIVSATEEELKLRAMYPHHYPAVRQRLTSAPVLLY